MKPEDLRRVVERGTLVCPRCKRPVRILLGDPEGRLLCPLCFGRHKRCIPV
jgi:hypothetical protein